LQRPQSNATSNHPARLSLKTLQLRGTGHYHTREFVEGARERGIVPHPALKAGQKTWRVRLTTAHALSQKLRKRVEEIFGWTKTTGCLRKSR
jgi:hypothetical protein